MNGWSIRCCSRASSRWSRCFTGTCPRRSTISAAGSIRISPDWFADYATVVFRRLDGRVKLWATLNEPWVVTDGGYLHGALAPGHRNRFEAPIAAHQLLRAPWRRGQAYRSEGKHRIGVVVNLEPKYPASETPTIAPPRRGPMPT